MHSLFNGLNENYSDSSYLYDNNHNNNDNSNSDYELVKTMPKHKSHENDLYSKAEEVHSDNQIKGDINGNTDVKNRISTNNNNNNLCLPGIYHNTGMPIECNKSQQDDVPIPIQLSALTFPHLPPPPSYPPPPLNNQQQHRTQQFTENQSVQNKTSLLIELQRYDLLLQRQRGTGKTSSGGEDNKTIESEQSEQLNPAWKSSNSHENSSIASTTILGQRKHFANHRIQEYSPDFNKLSGHKFIQNDFIGLATFRKADEKSIDLVTPYAQFDLSSDSSVYNSSKQ
ncbi:unnamed protein product [Trichobilharzia szidati]|nr:unnamed protein product [Trichobilharzia szidati]